VPGPDRSDGAAKLARPRRVSDAERAAGEASAAAAAAAMRDRPRGKERRRRGASEVAIAVYRGRRWGLGLACLACGARASACGLIWTLRWRLGDGWRRGWMDGHGKREHDCLRDAKNSPILI
jgi:hypothetical protein